MGIQSLLQTHNQRLIGRAIGVLVLWGAIGLAPEVALAEQFTGQSSLFAQAAPNPQLQELLTRGEDFVKRRDWESALVIYERAATLDRDNPRI